ncbi:PIN domain-like protein [Armillaria luteobubalina]|uniref:PIN domain-like protein n=1 Tax=Armillaria luteobubalina TaxID=153913 RepID=A0AA39Q390_9AGAR|nr:PIN domain-like protein [Armillaria luteobubalina]
MGVKGGWNLFKSIEPVSLIDWSTQTISSGPLHSLGPRVGVDASGWMFAAKYHSGQTKNAAQASLFKRLGRLFHLPIIPIFVFDGPGRPVDKRKKSVSRTTDWLTTDFKRLLDGFGFSYWDAPGEAEAELAMLSIMDRIDAVLSEDFDTMIFGARQVIRIKDESDSTYIIEVHEQGSQFSRNDLILIALLAGGDYDDGIYGCGIQTAVDIASTGISNQLFDVLAASRPQDFSDIAVTWRRKLCTMLENQDSNSRCFHHRSLVFHILPDFPNHLVLTQYVHPLTSQSNGGINLPAPLLPHQPDLPGLAQLCEELFIWGNSMGIIQNFCNHVFPGLAIWELLQDLCERRGLSQTNLSSHALISTVCPVRANQRKRAQSEAFVSLLIPSAIVFQITSAINGRNDNDITKNKLDNFMKKRNIRAWLSRVLMLHARPNILDCASHQILKTVRRRKISIHTKGIGQSRATESTTSNFANIASVRQKPALSKRGRSLSIIEISSDGSGDEIPEPPSSKRRKQASSPKYRIETHHSESGNVLELCTDSENGF